MAQLPPKAPTTTMSQNLATFDHHRPILDQPAMLDDFLDWPNFSTTRRSSHRRSASDSVTFLEATPINEFDGLDDDRLISMFSDDVAPHLASVSWASDCDSLNEEKPPASSMNDLGEAESAFVEDPPTMAQPTDGLASVLFDPKRVKRIIANRQSAQRSRVRKLQYISELERSVSTLQTEVSALSPRVAFLDQHRSILTMGNSNLKQRIAALAQDKIFKDARQEALKSEIERLRQVYQQQNLENMAHRTSDRAVGTSGELIT